MSKKSKKAAKPLSAKLRQLVASAANVGMNVATGYAEAVALFKAEDLEVMRLVLPAGKKLLNHHVPGAITLQCLEGEVELFAHQQSKVLQAGEMMYLGGGEPHELLARRDASVLLTVLLKP